MRRVAIAMREGDMGAAAACRVVAALLMRNVTASRVRRAAE